MGLRSAVATPGDLSDPEVVARVEESSVRVADPASEERLRAAIDAAKDRRDTLGGVFEVVAFGVMPGLGSHVQWDRKLDGRLAQAVMSIQAIKAVAMVAYVLADAVLEKFGGDHVDEVKRNAAAFVAALGRSVRPESART